MKKSILFLTSLLVFTTGCYDDYVRDFDYSATFIAYQYDLRTFVLDEGEQFKFTVALAGLMENDRDYNVELELDPSLLEGSLASFCDVSKVSGEYVSTQISAAGLAEITVLPDSYYTIEGMESLCIRKGCHTASVTLKAKEAMRLDSKMFAPYYALGFRIKSAETDKIVEGKDYAVIAVKCENRFFGSWSRSGKVVAYDASGTEQSVSYSSKSLADQYCYNLTTVDGTTVKSDKVAGSSGQMFMTFDGNQMTISSVDGKVAGTGSFNNSRLLQNRELYLDYTITEADRSRKEVCDTLYFRNRVRDGVNEWQDENPENYQ